MLLVVFTNLCALLASFNLKYLLVFVGLLISTNIVLMQIKEISSFEC